MEETMKTLQEIPDTSQAEVLEPTDVAQEMPETAEAAPEQPRSDKEENLRKLREAKERAEKERDAYYAKLRELEEMRAAAEKEAQPEQRGPEFSDDDLIEGRHLKALRKEMETMRAQSEQAAIEARVKSQYPDFDRVVNENTINKFRTAYPELAATLASSGDLYNKAASAYTLIKQMGIYEGSQSAASGQQVQDNSQKPRPASSASSPLSQANAFANGLTDDLKAKLYREMVESRRSS